VEQKVLNLISTIRASFGASIAVYTCGNCYQLYEILKMVFPDAEAFESKSGHVFTKIDGEFYDIRGKLDINQPLIPITDSKRIESLSKNKWTDERRKEYGVGNGAVSFH